MGGVNSFVEKSPSFSLEDFDFAASCFFGTLLAASGSKTVVFLFFFCYEQNQLLIRYSLFTFNLIIIFLDV